VIFSRAISGATLAPAFSCPAWADFSGDVPAVAGGDTLIVLDDRRQVKVRPAEIDALALGPPITARVIMWSCNDAYGGSIA
jgi:hypothetical protein